MKKLKVNADVEFEAVQYGVDTEAKDYVQKGYRNYRGDVVQIPGDMLGSPKDAFDGVLTVDGFRKIEVGDFILKRGDEIHVVSRSFIEFIDAR